MKKIDRFRLALSLLAALLAGCQGLEPSATPPPFAPIQTSTPPPTKTPLPSATFSPVPPAVPTATASPTPDLRCQFSGLPGRQWFHESARDPDFWQSASPEQVGLDPELLRNRD